jgi:hypothetical protein
MIKRHTCSHTRLFGKALHWLDTALQNVVVVKSDTTDEYQLCSSSIYGEQQ